MKLSEHAGGVSLGLKIGGGNENFITRMKHQSFLYIFAFGSVSQSDASAELYMASLSTRH